VCRGDQHVRVRDDAQHSGSRVALGAGGFEFLARERRGFVLVEV
jgi:hypothetical protein